jgi:hypothetical protein
MFETTATYTNTTKVDQIVWMEPWCESITIAANKTFLFHGTGTVDGSIAIENRDEGVIVYGWPTSKVKVTCDGMTVWEAYADVPPVPEGMSVQTFIQSVFHRKPSK